MNNFFISKVNMVTISIFADILKEAAEWLISKNMKNWEPSRFNVENILKDCDLNELYLCYYGDEAAGCFRMQTADEIFWPEAPEGEALYIHKLAIRRKFAGKGVSGVIIDWVKEQAGLRKIKLVRLDCIANRVGLCRVYKEQGFTKVDEKQIFGKFPSARFEYKIGD